MSNFKELDNLNAEKLSVSFRFLIGPREKLYDWFCDCQHHLNQVDITHTISIITPTQSTSHSTSRHRLFSRGLATLQEALSVRWSVRRSITLKSKSGKTRISAPAHPSATDGRVSGLVDLSY